MIAKISRGWRVRGLIAYLMGPGRFNEHTDPRVVASWDGAAERHQPVRCSVGPGFEVDDLADALADPAVAAGVPQQEPALEPGVRVPRGPVWHCSLRNHAGDRVLSDAEWEAIVVDLMHRAGIAPRGDLGACRWVAIRHADDHVHVAAVLVRQDTGRRVHPRDDYRRAREACQAAEQAYGLTPTGAVDRTAVEATTRAELEKSAKRGRSEPSREWLRRASRVAAVQARDPEEYFRRLGDLGVLVRPKQTGDGQLIGYSVADGSAGGLTVDGLPGGAPVYFSGRKLARDLALPQLVARWASAPAPPVQIPPQSGERSQIGEAERVAAVTEAVAAIELATAELARRPGGPHARWAGGGGGPADADEVAAAIAHSAGDMAVALGAVLARSGSGEAASRAERLYDRATRQTRIGQPRRWAAVASQLRSSAWRLAAVRSVGYRRGNDAGVAELIVALAALIAEIAAYHEQRQCLAQAAAARSAAAVLRDHRGGAGSAPGGGGRPAELGTGPGTRLAADREVRRRGRVAADPLRPVAPGTPGQPETRGRGRDR